MRTRRARLPDAQHIHNLILGYSQRGTLLPRTLAEVCENVRDFVVAEHRGKIIGCGALHLYGTHLTEIRSICVDPNFKGNGAGAQLVAALLAEADYHHVSCVCLFTRIPSFFARYGFRVAKREELPDKIYKDWLKCPKLHASDEIAMVRGELPHFAILGDFPAVKLPILAANAR
jgi:amino-acid N-acetyltransferase